jgi:hypothetical protein
MFIVRRKIAKSGATMFHPRLKAVALATCSLFVSTMMPTAAPTQTTEYFGQVSATQDNRPVNCQVTLPSDGRFTPPKPYPAQPDSKGVFSFWFGTDYATNAPNITKTSGIIAASVLHGYGRPRVCRRITDSSHFASAPAAPTFFTFTTQRHRRTLAGFSIGPPAEILSVQK